MQIRPSKNNRGTAMKFTTLPNEIVSELLFYLAENETFPSVGKNLEPGVTASEVKSVMHELAVWVAREASETKATSALGGLDISPNSRKILSKLDKREGESLVSAFISK